MRIAAYVLIAIAGLLSGIFYAAAPSGQAVTFTLSRTS
jgi:hypothetical protein